jgi:hypothetical protein
MTHEEVGYLRNRAASASGWRARADSALVAVDARLVRPYLPSQRHRRELERSALLPGPALTRAEGMKP